MALVAWVNELSFAEDVDDATAATAFGAFVDLVAKLPRRARVLAVASHVPLAQLSISDRFGVEQWIGRAPIHRDRWRALRGIENRSPFRVAHDPRVSELVEHTHEERAALGLGFAAMTEGFGLSAPTTERWDVDAVWLDRRELTEIDDDLVWIASRVDVPHASRAEHLDRHADWLVREVHWPTTPDELWRLRDRWFPDLEFLPPVREQLDSLGPGHPWFHQARLRLMELQATTAEWDPGMTPTPRWRTKVTSESASRRDLCWFEDIDGERRCFEWHARMTPDPGRLHFRIDAGRRKLVVAYVGRKLGV